MRDGPVRFALLLSSLLFCFVCLAISRPKVQVNKYAPAFVSASEPALLVECQKVHPVTTSPEAPNHAFGATLDRCQTTLSSPQSPQHKACPLLPGRSANPPMSAHDDSSESPPNSGSSWQDRRSLREICRRQCSY